MTEHTPIWIAEGNTIGIDDRYQVCCGNVSPNHGCCGEPTWDGGFVVIGTFGQQDDAALAAKCVNAHDDLVAALKEVIRSCENRDKAIKQEVDRNPTWPSYSWHGLENAIDNAKQALEKAGAL